MRRLILASTICLAAVPALAADVVTAWVQQLALDGYEEVEVSRTWLGRTRIVAEKDDVEREIILNPRTGEVLRDYSQAEDGSLRLPLGFEVELDEDTHGDGEHGGGDD